MSLEVAAIADGVLKAALPKVVGAIATAVTNKLNPTDLQRTLEAGLRAADALNTGQQVRNPVFYHCTDKQRETFLAKFLEHSTLQEELQKPLKQAGMPDVAVLVQVARQISADHSIPTVDAELEPWLTMFAQAYFEQTSAFLRVRVAKQDYLTQLVIRCDDVKFAGVAVEGQEIEKAERLAQIFVMPDVQEDGRSRDRSSLWEMMDAERGDRQLALLQDQRDRVWRDRGGRQFSAQQLLKQNPSRLVLLGAPGSGKTTLLSYFAVMLAQHQTEALGLTADTDWLPILIRMRDWEQHANPALLDYARHFAETTLSCKALPISFFDYWLERGQALILLDDFSNRMSK